MVSPNTNAGLKDLYPDITISECAFAENAGGTAVNVDSTFGGFTLQQVVQALIQVGVLTINP